MLAARAASCSFLTFGTIAVQRGRSPQLVFIKSRINSAVVLGSIVTDLSSGAGGGFTLVHSETISPARPGATETVVAVTIAAAAMKALVAHRRLLFKSVMTLSSRSVCSIRACFDYVDTYHAVIA